MKRPAFQFYPGDWLKDAALRSCSLEARGLWMDMISHMHQAEPYGHLVLNGRPIDEATLGRMVGATAGKVRRLIEELEQSGTCSRREDGALYSRRMVKDEQLRNERAEFGKLGGNPNLLKGKVNPPLIPEPTPSSSSSSSSSKETTAASPPRAEFSQAFETAWAEYPKRNGDNPKRQAAKAWSARITAGRTPAEMIDGVRRYAAWCRDTGKAGSETVMQAKRFFGPDEPFKNTWSAAPEKPKIIIPDCRITGCKREGLSSLGGVCEVHYAQSKPVGNPQTIGSLLPKVAA